MSPRGDDGREFPWGAQYRTGLANLVDLGIGTTMPVGSFPECASPFGVLDMAGNADEWTSTLYAPYPGAPSEVPDTEDWAFDPHVTRGGAFRHDRDLARCARRHGTYEQDMAAVGVGFRLAAPTEPDRVALLAERLANSAVNLLAMARQIKGWAPSADEDGTKSLDG